MLTLYALDFCQSDIDTIYYALPFLRLSALETRLAFPDTSYKQNVRGSYGGHMAEELYSLAGYIFFSDQEPWPEEVPLYIPVTE